MKTFYDVVKLNTYMTDSCTPEWRSKIQKGIVFNDAFLFVIHRFGMRHAAKQEVNCCIGDLWPALYRSGDCGGPLLPYTGISWSERSNPVCSKKTLVIKHTSQILSIIFPWSKNGVPHFYSSSILPFACIRRFHKCDYFQRLFWFYRYYTSVKKGGNLVYQWFIRIEVADRSNGLFSEYMASEAIGPFFMARSTPIRPSSHTPVTTSMSGPEMRVTLRQPVPAFSTGKACLYSLKNTSLLIHKAILLYSFLKYFCILY